MIYIYIYHIYIYIFRTFFGSQKRIFANPANGLKSIQGILLTFALLSFFHRTSFAIYLGIFFNKILPKIFNDKAKKKQLCCFSFFNANFELAHVHLLMTYFLV